MRRPLPALGVALALLAIGFAVAPSDLWSYDAWMMSQVAHSMIYDNNFLVHEDPFNISKPYAAFGIGMSLLMAVAELLGPLLDRSPSNLDALINPIVVAAIGVVVWMLARALGATARRAAAIALIVVLATPLLPYAASTFVEPATALGVALGLLGLELTRRREFLGGLLAGLGAGIAVLMRVDSLLLVAPVLAIGVFVVARRRFAAALGFAAGAFPCVALVAWYNMVRFGSPLVSQYQGMSFGRAFGHPFLTGLYGLTLSPARGLVIFAPLALVIAFGARWSWQRSKAMTLVCLVLIADRIVFYAQWYAWHGGTGWGPRFLIPAMPALAPFVVEVVRRLPTARASARIAFAALVIVGLAVQVVGVATRPDWDRMMAVIIDRDARVPAGATITDKLASPAGMAAWDEPLMDWSLSPILDHAQQLARGQNLASRFLNPEPRPIPLIVLGLILLAGLVLSFLRRDEAGATPTPAQAVGVPHSRDPVPEEPATVA